MDQLIVSTIHIAGLVKKILLVLSIHIAAKATNDIDMAMCIVPSRACILKPSICIAGRRRNILNEKHRITYRIVSLLVFSILKLTCWPPAKGIKMANC